MLPGIVPIPKARSIQSSYLYLQANVRIRNYAVSVSPSKIYPKKKMPRQYSVRKTFLLDKYSKLLDTDSPLLLLSHKNFTTPGLIRLRRDIDSIQPAPVPPSQDFANMVAAPSAFDVPQFTVVQSGLLGVALRENVHLDLKTKRLFAHAASPGALAILSLPALHPPQLAALFRILSRAVPPKKPPLTPEQRLAAEEEARLAVLENPTPGRRKKRVRPDLPPELELKGALIERRLYLREELDAISKLPSLETLQAQLLGLLTTPAMQIARVLSQASGGQLTRTLDGFRKGLEMAQEEARQ